MVERKQPRDIEGVRDGEPQQAARGGIRRFVLVGARGFLGIASVGIAAASIAAATLVPLPHLGVQAVSTKVIPVAADQKRICAGPALQLGDDTGLEATTAVSLGRADVTRSATSGTPILDNMTATENPANSPSQVLVLPPPPFGEPTGILAGSQSQHRSDDGIAGFAASECIKASAESWLVGGSTTTGRTTLLALNNPTKVNATVTLTIYSENGRLSAAGTEGIVVPPGGRRVLSLAGFAPDIVSPVVKVESVGGQVAAFLQQSTVRVLTPGGLDVVTASTAPAPVTVIPGVVIAGPDDVVTTSALGGYGDLAPILRVFVPGEGPAEITVSAIPEDGSAPAHSATLQVQSGKVTDFPLDDFTAGSWTLAVTSDRPAVASARTSTVELRKAAAANSDTAFPALDDVLSSDFAWYVGAPKLDERALVSVAPGPSPMLHFVNAASSDAAIIIDATRGAGTTVTVPAGQALAIPVGGDVSYLLSGFDSVRVSVSYQGKGALAAFVVSPPDRGSAPITVFSQFG